MKKAKDSDTYFFVDESGDPTFYNARGKLIVGQGGCSQILMLGLIETQRPTALRRAVLDLHGDVLQDTYLQKIPSFADTSIAFHANKDCPEVRYLVYRMLAQQNFRAQFVVSRKDEKIFQDEFHGSEAEYYDYLVARLFQHVLHRYKRNRICFSARGSSDRREPLQHAIVKAKENFESFHNTKIADDIVFDVKAQSPKGEPCLTVIDYMAWALQRAYTRGQTRYYDYVADKVSYIHEVGVCRYSKKLPFDVSKAALLQLGSS